MGPAVRLLTTYRSPTPCACGFSIDCDAGSRPLQPRAGAPTGHMEWIRQLRGLDAFGSVEFYNVDLRAGDLSCLGHTLCNLTGEPDRCRTDAPARIRFAWLARWRGIVQIRHMPWVCINGLRWDATQSCIHARVATVPVRIECRPGATALLLPSGGPPPAAEPHARAA